jgi:hypothetical protein
MKIVSQSPDEMVLHEGSWQGLVVGGAFVVAGALAGYFLHAAQPAALWIGLAAVGVGAAIVCFASSITVNATKSKDQLVHEKKRIAGTRTAAYRISDVLRIETRKKWEMQNNNTGGNRDSAPTPVLMAQTVIVFKSGKELPLDHQKSSSSMRMGPTVLTGGQSNETAIGNRVAAFLGVPFQEIMPPNTMGGGGWNIQIGGR